MKITLLLIRHGETLKNITGSLHKPGDKTKLDELGIKQMEQVAETIKNFNVDQVYCSDTVRTEQSADIICKKLNLNKMTIPNMQERLWGELENKPWNDIEKVLKEMKLDQRYVFKPKNGESWRDLEKRASKQIKQLMSNGNQCIAVISHGGVIRALIPWLLKSSKKDALQIIDNGSISTFVFENKKLVSSDINNTSHLK